MDIAKIPGPLLRILLLFRTELKYVLDMNECRAAFQRNNASKYALENFLKGWSWLCV